MDSPVFSERLNIVASNSGLGKRTSLVFTPDEAMQADIKSF